ncbi:hypothetical protein ILP92_15180 [Maribius pontilimi]|uniref:Uncharacterized protein n=1 Tax=Palleronia pontilimi TaxID=1964209 RepID=A0A934IGR9_9RHOB|nr:hypothetical protein [Palleronia pontilimi]MBJ3764092.1 hypothetical protein [Palleronia pontilimi]
MSRHILDHVGPKQSPRAVRSFLKIRTSEARGGISRLIATLDRKQKLRTGAQLPAFLKIKRGHRS